MAYTAWKESTTMGLDIVECIDLPWEKDFHDFIETFRGAKVEAIIVTDLSFNNGKYTLLFKNEGCRIVGPKAFTRHEKRSTGIENVEVVGTLIIIGKEDEKMVNSDD